MIRRLFLLAICSVLFANVYSQETDEILLTIGDDKVTTDEFIRVYSKNNQDPKFDRESLEEYLDLFINFKLKVAEAESLKLDTTESFINEYGSYVKQLEAPYFRDESLIDSIVVEAYENMHYEVNVSHILVKCPLGAPVPPKILKEKIEKIEAIREKALNGSDFGELAKKYSEDLSAKDNLGELGYFSVFSMVYPFEKVAFSTPKGRVSEIIRTQFGYHILKVNDKRESLGEVRVAHIMFMIPNGSSVLETEEAKTKSYAIYDSLMMGKSFDEMAYKYSEDRNTAENGGVLPFFKTGRMVKEFSDVAFGLDSIGEISKPVKTPYGYHIIMLKEKKKIGSFEDEKGEIIGKVRKRIPAEEPEELVLSRLRKEYGVKSYIEKALAIVPLMDSSIYEGLWESSPLEGYTEVVMSIADSVFTQLDFIKFVESKKVNLTKVLSFEDIVEGRLRDFEEAMLKEYERMQLPIKYPEFKYLVQEYHDGILLFNLTDQMVWTKAVEDTAGLEAFYVKNDTNHMWGDRVQATIYTYSDDSYSSKVLAMAKKVAKKDLDSKSQALSFQNKINKKDTAFTIISKTAKFSKGDNNIVDVLEWVSGESKKVIGNKNGEFILVYIHNPVSPEPKLLSEAKGLFTAEYQAELEKEWIATLRKKYDYKVDEEVFNSLVK